MASDRFQVHKHSCGKNIANLEEVRIEVPGLGGDFNFDFAGCEENWGEVNKEKGEEGEEEKEGWAIRDGMMVFKRLVCIFFFFIIALIG
jgi:hypothetical protein